MLQPFYSIAPMNALFSSIAWCAAMPNRWSILALMTFAVIWPFVNGDRKRRPSYAGQHQWHNGIGPVVGPGRGERAFCRCTPCHLTFRKFQVSSKAPRALKLLE
jgi:hypothetical protein